MNITEFIKADLKTRIVSGRFLPAKLTLTALSEHYSVSATPVRRAVSELIAERYLQKRSNGRLVFDERWRGPGNWEISAKSGLASDETAPDSANRVPPASGALPAPSESVPAASGVLPAKSEQAEAITAEIIRRSLSGATGFLREEAASEEHGVGRSVIRAIFSTLAGRGLIEHVPRRGWRIRPYREADMLQYLDVRESLELKALDLAWPRLERDRIAVFLAGNSPNKDGRQQIDNRLHQYWIERSSNRYIIDFFAGHGGYYDALFDRAAIPTNVIAQAAAEHRDILQAILSNDRRQARESLTRHIQGQRPKVSRMYEDLQAGCQPTVLDKL
ncbi:MAG: GntR family transcriptional regulator [Pirellulales bacterium]|nr:GntR family transcriptional regulator [Pirellulales bacterium]